MQPKKLWTLSKSDIKNSVGVKSKETLNTIETPKRINNFEEE